MKNGFNELFGMGEDEMRKQLAELLRDMKAGYQYVPKSSFSTMDGIKAIDKIEFIGGPMDGRQLEVGKEPPKEYAARCYQVGAPVFVAPEPIAQFYDVAVYSLQCTPEGREFYRFEGFSFKMWGLD